MPAEYERIKASLSKVLQDNDLAFTTDLWTNEYSQRSYFTLSAHYINEDWELTASVLATREFPDDIKTGENILKAVIDVLKEFQIEHKLENGFMVTDNGANVVKAFRSYKRLSCACHNINLLMEDVLNKDPIEDIKILICESKKIVEFFKRSQLNTKLTKSLKQHVKTRWNSIFIMLQSIDESYKEMQDILNKRGELYRLGKIDQDLLKKVLKFLEIFKECSERLSSDSVPTINETVLVFEKI